MKNETRKIPPHARNVGAKPVAMTSSGNAARSFVSKISGDQVVRTPASADVDPGSGGTYQITVGIERVKKARLIGASIWLNSPQCVFLDEK
jgi:hypothetical protein